MKRLLIPLVLLMVLVATFLPQSVENVHASTIPTFSIVSVVEDSQVTIKTYNFPKDLDFKVTMGKYGTKGIGGVVVATTNSGEGGSLTLTYDIPAELKGLDRIAIRLEATSGVYYAFNWFWNNPSEAGSGTTPPSPGYSGIPTFSIVSVEEDAKVTIKTNNFPKDVDFKVLMGPYGTKGIAGTLVTTTNSADGGALTLTYDIPAGLKGLDRIAIRLEATSGIYYAFNWFWNNTSEAGSGTPPPTPGYSGIPTFSIVSVEEDAKVTIKTNNFPKDVDFKVLMGPYGTKGIAGTLVTTTNSADGGTLTLTYDIPAGLKGLDRIAIRLEATSGGYYAFNWFWNNDSAASVTPTPVIPVVPVVPVVPGYTGVPTFVITAVVADDSVTIKTNNLPKDVEFKVLMGKYGTAAIGGTLVTTTDSGDGGVLTLTYNIPDGLKGLDRIAIRLEATSGGYFAYNWFWNNTYP